MRVLRETHTVPGLALKVARGKLSTALAKPQVGAVPQGLSRVMTGQMAVFHRFLRETLGNPDVAQAVPRNQVRHQACPNG